MTRTWMDKLFEAVDHPLFGSYPDWRQPGPEFDNLAYLEKMLPYAKGMSYRNQPDGRIVGTDDTDVQEDGLYRLVRH